MLSSFRPEILIDYLPSAISELIYDPYVYIAGLLLGFFFKKRLLLACLWVACLALSYDLDTYAMIAYTCTLMGIAYIVAIIVHVMRPKNRLRSKAIDYKDSKNTTTASRSTSQSEQKHIYPPKLLWDNYKSKTSTTSAPTSGISKQVDWSTFENDSTSYFEGSRKKDNAFTDGADTSQNSISSAYTPFKLERYQFDFTIEEFDISDDNPDSTLDTTSVTAAFNLRQARASLNAKSKSQLAKPNPRIARETLGSLRKNIR